MRVMRNQAAGCKLACRINRGGTSMSDARCDQVRGIGLPGNMAKVHRWRWTGTGVKLVGAKLACCARTSVSRWTTGQTQLEIELSEGSGVQRQESGRLIEMQRLLATAHQIAAGAPALLLR